MEVKRIVAPRGVLEGVQAWSEPVSIPTYPAMPPDPNPMFLERRVYQGSSGKVYPLPFIDRVSTEKVDKVYEAIHIENEFLYVMILPEIGGRIHVAVDKTNDYDFFYRQNVIKPALVGLAGPWISGGVEINWPQHHRPSTFMPCAWWIEEHDDGSQTVWLSEHEPMNRMKGMHGVRLRPGSACLELQGLVYNRTPFTQTFLWWANVGVRVNDDYQSFFPPDVRFVADHAKRAMSSFPECTGFYYGVDYRPATGLDWYKNIPVPTSYMVLHSDYDFFGGYDHGRKAGFVHVADRYIAPGKKQWTWGNHPFGWAWDRNLTDSDGPYVELMAGVYTDNQPDFSFLAPYETRTFKQVWYPIQGIGPATFANEDFAVSVRVDGDVVLVGVSPSRVLSGEVSVGGDSREVRAAPGSPWFGEFAASGSELVVALGGSRVVLSLADAQPDLQAPSPATEPAAPEDIESLEELYLAGLHLEQYRHATRKPETYWREALRRDPLDSRCNVAMANWHLRRGEFGDAEGHARRAIERSTSRNPNPRDGEAFYVLGMALERQGKLDETVGAYMKATWNYAWAAAAHFRVACVKLRLRGLECRDEAVEHLRQSLRGLGSNGNARALLAALFRRSGDLTSALAEARIALDADQLCHWALREAFLSASDGVFRERFERAMLGDPQNYLDLAIDYASAGMIDDALAVLDEGGDSPMIGYARAFYGGARGSVSGPLAIFPSRLEEMEFLRNADPGDAFAPYLLGNMYYDRGRNEEAIEAWERSVGIDPAFSIPWRNLGIAYFNVRRDPAMALEAFDKAVAASPRDARLAFERDQLLKRIGESAERRLEQLDLSLAELRDDLSLELCGLYNATGQHENALAILSSRRFSPWEGGEGVALGEWTKTHLALGRKAFESGEFEFALERFLAAESPPENLGEARHLLANASDVWFWLGEAYAALGRDEEARRWWIRAAEFRGDFQEMSVQAFSEMTPFQAMALRRLGREAEASGLLRGLARYADELERSPAKIDYFATSLPTMLLFEDDLRERQNARARLLRELGERV